VDRVKDVKQKVDGLRKIYIMMNGKGSWLAELGAALLKAGQWEVPTSRDLSLKWEHKADFAGSGHVCCAEGTGICREWSECP
jgi:hypothetical protein